MVDASRITASGEFTEGPMTDENPTLHRAATRPTRRFSPIRIVVAAVIGVILAFVLLVLYLRMNPDLFQGM